MRSLLGWGIAVGLGLLLVVVLFSSEEGPGPAPRIESEPISRLFPREPVLRESLPSETVPRSEPGEATDAASRERQQRLARDPARIEIAERALGGFENLFLDPTALESVGAGEIRGGMLPQALSHRRIALAAIDTVIAQPENAGVIRARSVRVLEALVQQPWPDVATPEADQFVLQERGHALASLVKADSEAAATAYQGIAESDIQERVANRAVHLLVQGGMEKAEARDRIARLPMR